MYQNIKSKSTNDAKWPLSELHYEAVKVTKEDVFFLFYTHKIIIYTQVLSCATITSFHLIGLIGNINENTCEGLWEL